VEHTEVEDPWGVEHMAVVVPWGAHMELEEFLQVAFMLEVMAVVAALQEELCMQQDGAWDLEVQWDMVPGWDQGWAAAPPFKQIQDVALVLEHQTPAAVLVVQRLPVEEWEQPALKVQGPWSLLEIGHMLAKETVTIRLHLVTTMLARVLAASQKRR